MAFLCRFYSSPYSIATGRMMGPASLAPYMHSPVSAYQVTPFVRSGTRCQCLNRSRVWLRSFPQVHNPSWLHHQSYIMPPTVSVLARCWNSSPSPSAVLTPPLPSLSHQGAVLTSGMDHSMSIHPTSMMGPLTQQLSHLTIGSSGTVSSPSLAVRPGGSVTNLFSRCLSAAVHACKRLYAGDLHPPVHSSACHQHVRRGKALLPAPPL